MKLGGIIGYTIVLLFLGMIIGLGINASFFPDPKNPPPLSWVALGIAFAFVISGVLMIWIDDLEENESKRQDPK